MMNGSRDTDFEDVLSFSLVDAIFGRRSRRFFMGAEIPDGIFSYKSRYTTVPLSDEEKLLILSSCGANTSWHHMIFRAQRYAPHLPNYSGAAGGRTFPSSAGFHTSVTFFTDDNGVYYLDMRDAPAFSRRHSDGTLSIPDMLSFVENRIHKLQIGRLDLPHEPPFVEPHNTWVVNQPGSFLIIPVADLSQHILLNLCYMLQNGLVIYDDVNRCAIPGIEEFNSIVDISNTWPLTFVDQWSLGEATAELSTSCYAGSLMLQAIGLGGWMFNGIDAFSVLGASGNENIKGLGFRYDKNENWPYPNPTGLQGIMEGYCPPHFNNMRDAVEAICDRKFNRNGPFHPETPGPWKHSKEVRAAAQVHSEQFRRCIALQAQYIYDTFGKFPATVPSIFCIVYLQAHHLDLEFYNRFFEKGAYLQTHEEHMGRWH